MNGRRAAEVSPRERKERSRGKEDQPGRSSASGGSIAGMRKAQKDRNRPWHRTGMRQRAITANKGAVPLPENPEPVAAPPIITGPKPEKGEGI
ncbi:MAG TPA: hypothetical protein VFI90_05745 [Rubrobacter sp.]|nr:hypothetical protein [Rubrobacter sp.]